ncbi:MAG: glyoxylate reductase [Cyclobacteriaceae bacterium]|jgi:glyoxylate reductase
MSKTLSEAKIFISRKIPAIGVALLKKKGFEVSVFERDEPLSQEELIENVADFDALLSIGHNKLDTSTLEQCKHLKIISQFGAGYDHIDIDKATELGILIGNTPLAMNDATADIAFGLMIATARKMFYMHKKILRGEWGVFRSQANLGFELKNKTLGILGLGRIGEEMALRCKGAYNMEVIYHNRSRNNKAEETLDAKWVEFDDLLAKSDVISVHCALTDQTKGIFGASAFKKMKDSAIFINTSRGKVHNENDLIRSLEEGEIWGAGLDVTDPEPMNSDNALLSMENVCVLPHIGSATVEARNEMSRLCAINVIEFFQGKQVTNAVNPEVLDGR